STERCGAFRVEKLSDASGQSTTRSCNRCILRDSICRFLSGQSGLSFLEKPLATSRRCCYNNGYHGHTSRTLVHESSPYIYCYCLDLYTPGDYCRWFLDQCDHYQSSQTVGYTDKTSCSRGYKRKGGYSRTR